MAPQADCSNYRLIMGQWYMKTASGGMVAIPASQVPSECQVGGIEGAAPQMMASKRAKPKRAAKRAKPKRAAKKAAAAARGPKKRKGVARGRKKR
jgi:hypothetical protein